VKPILEQADSEYLCIRLHLRLINGRSEIQVKRKVGDIDVVARVVVGD